jgi:cyanophycinase
MNGLTHQHPLGRRTAGGRLTRRGRLSRAVEPVQPTVPMAVVDKLATCSAPQPVAADSDVRDSGFTEVASGAEFEVVIRSRSHTGTDAVMEKLAEPLPDRWTEAGSPQASATPCVEPLTTSVVVQRAGQLVIIGGAEDRAGGAVILRRFRDLCGGENARIAVLGTATRIPIEVGHDYIQAFRAIGVEEVVMLPLASRYEANAAETIKILEGVDGVFFTGGDQQRISAIVGGSRVGVWLHQKFEQGLVIAGTSAGAAMMSSIMILGGSGKVTSTSAVSLGPGLGFLPGVVIDMHFSERRRLPRLLAAVARFPHDLGIGIDEDTALIVDGNRLEVIGAGAVTIIDASEATSSVNPHDERPIALTGALIHVLATGYAFDLATRSAEITTGPEVERRLSQAS